jgi:hypothetical protein
MKKSAKVLHYFGLDCGMLTFPAFLEAGLAEKIELFSNIYIAGYALLKAYPMAPLSCRSNLAGRVPLNLSTDFTNPKINSGKIRGNNSHKNC